MANNIDQIVAQAVKAALAGTQGAPKAPKRSGAKTKLAQKGAGKGKRVTYGWKLTDGIMYHYFAGLINKPGKKSESGNVWQGCVVQITNTRTGETSPVGGAMIIEGPSDKIGKVIFGNMVMNPHAANGGYTGRFGKK